MCIPVIDALHLLLMLRLLMATFLLSSRVTLKFTLATKKSSQHSVRGLRALGVAPNVLAYHNTSVSLSLSLSLMDTFVYVNVLTSKF